MKRDSGSTVRLASRVAVAAVVVLATVGAGTAAAAGTTAVRIDASDGRVDVGATTTYGIVVTNASDGVGAAELGVAVDDPTVATVVDATVLGDGSEDVEFADDNSSVDVVYAFRDTADTGSVTVLEVTLRGQSSGTTGVSVVPAAGDDAVVVYDEGGTGYDLTEVGRAEVRVESTGDGPDDPDPEVPFGGGTVPGVAADGPPTDPNGDGLYEDVDGDGEFDFVDVIDLLFADKAAVNANPAGRAALNFDGRGDVGFADVIHLLFDLG